MKIHLNVFSQMETADKVKVAIFGTIMAVAVGNLAYRWGDITGNTPDQTVTSFVVGGMDASDPNHKHRTVTTTFANHDGKLELTEYPDNPAQQATIVWHADYRRDNKPTVWQNLAKISNPRKQSLAIVAYRVAYRNFTRIPRDVGLTTDQAAAEKKARERLLADLDLIGTGPADGRFHATDYQQVIDSLKAYKDNTADPAKDLVKQQQAAAVIQLGRAYLDGLEEARDSKVQEYVATLNGLLSNEQCDKLAGAMQPFAQRMVRRRYVAG